MNNTHQGKMIHVPNTLRLKVGGHLERVDVVALAKAEAAIKRFANNDEAWLQHELNKLDAVRECIRADGYTAETADCLRLRAVELRGAGSTCGYPLITEIASSLCGMISDPATRLNVSLVVLDAHIGSIKAAVRGKIRTNDHPNAKVLLAKLQTLVREHQA